jgi:phosphoenolpyruvate synthase/pyruvate phosphate dikinase
MQKCLFDLLFSDQCVYKKLLRNISNNAHISYDDIEQYYHADLIKLVTQNEKLDYKIVSSRKQSSAITKTNNGELEFVSSMEADALFDVLYGQNDARNVLKGMMGHSIGKVVKGKVKIIHTDYKNPDKVKKEMSEMEDGQVLVSQITAPELMPAIKKAIAIVTDIGGMLSHAAIISRELNIPCVIGTKNASEVLKDGDIVEVDADNGVVRIISKND